MAMMAGAGVIAQFFSGYVCVRVVVVTVMVVIGIKIGVNVIDGDAGYLRGIIKIGSVHHHRVLFVGGVLLLPLPGAMGKMLAIVEGKLG